MSDRSQSLVDRLWRAAPLLLATAFATYAAWQFIARLLPALLMIGGLLVVIGLAVGGFSRRRRW